ncbi:MAG: ATP-binding cassette domain-containing protein [Burkholderiales bacterium]
MPDTISERRDAIIEVRALTRKYGDALAVDHIDFSVMRGEVFFLGPNGAGKSTTVRMLTGYIPPTSGTIRVAGYDVLSHPSAARQYLGVVPEEANVYADLTVWQNVTLMAELHGMARKQRIENGQRLLESCGLAERAKQLGRELSKGLRQRLMLCMALVSEPHILFLDEPTSRLDVASTHLIREIISELNRTNGTTVFLTTHNIEEADALCHRVAIINKGRIAAIDTPSALRATVQSRRSVEVRFADEERPPAEMMEFGAAVETSLLAHGARIFGSEPGQIAQELANRATARGYRIESLATREPTLEEVFLHLTSTGSAVQEPPSHA